MSSAVTLTSGPCNFGRVVYPLEVVYLTGSRIELTRFEKGLTGF